MGKTHEEKKGKGKRGIGYGGAERQKLGIIN